MTYGFTGKGALRLLSSALLLLSLTLTPLAALAQETTGNIEGTVSDASGGRVPNATVKIEGAAFSRTLTTDANGFFRALSVKPGIYTVTVSADSFRSVNIERVEVVLGQNTPLDIVLEAGGVTEEVTVTGSDVAAVDTTASKIQTNITSQVIDLIPKGTNFTSVLQVSPGTRSEPNSGGFQIDGASGSENTFIIDGQEVTNFRTGTLNANNNLPLPLIQEVQVKTNGFEAEYGGATGGVVNVVTKSGSNDWHGEFGFQFESDALSASSFATGTTAGGGLIRRVLLADTSNLVYINQTRDDFTNWYPSATISGPVLKDRLWFLASFSPQFFTVERTFPYADGTVSPVYKSEVRRDYSFARLDAQLMDNLRVYGTFTYNPIRAHGLLPTSSLLYASGTAADAPDVQTLANQGGRQPASNFSVGGTWTPTSKLVVNLRGGRSYLNEKLTGNYGVINDVNIRCINGDPAGSCGAGFALYPVGSNDATIRDISIRKTFDADVSYLVSDFFGRHNFKAGVQVNHISNDASSGYVSTGEVRLFYGGVISDASGNLRGDGPGEAGYGYIQRFGTEGQASSTNTGIYVQDTWQPTSRLTLNLGLRAERENVPAFNEGGASIEFDFVDKLAPRLGFAYDMLGNGNWKVFASFGRFFDRFKYELPRGSFGGDFFLRDYFVIPQGAPYTLFTREYSLANAFLQRDFRIPSNVPDPENPLGPTTLGVDPDLKAVRQTEFTAGTEYMLSSDMILRARYTHKQIDRTIEDVGIPRASDGSEFYFIANPGFGIVNQSLISGVPPAPKAERKYDAMEIGIEKRFTNNYYINASYTLSRLYGNYGGLASSDESGRNSPNVNRYFDLPFEAFTPDGRPNNGRLSTDRPHTFKFYGAYTLNWFGATEFSTFFTAQSGTPVTTRVDLFDVATVVLNERGDLGRTSAFTQTDFAVRHRFNLGEDGRYGLQFDMNVINLFNESNELGRYELITLGVFDAGNFGEDNRVDAIRKIFNGGLRQEILNQLGSAGFEQDARYNQPNLFQGPREVRFGVRFLF